MSSDRRYLIIGAGAIGGALGAVLTRAGIPTVLIARGRHAETLASTGLTLRTPDGTFHTRICG
jgi:2-dehydropantoate 2-reductase